MMGSTPANKSIPFLYTRRLTTTMVTAKAFKTFLNYLSFQINFQLLWGFEKSESHCRCQNMELTFSWGFLWNVRYEYISIYSIRNHWNHARIHWGTQHSVLLTGNAKNRDIFNCIQLTFTVIQALLHLLAQTTSYRWHNSTNISAVSLIVFPH